MAPGKGPFVLPVIVMPVMMVMLVPVDKRRCRNSDRELGPYGVRARLELGSSGLGLARLDAAYRNSPNCCGTRNEHRRSRSSAGAISMLQPINGISRSRRWSANEAGAIHEREEYGWLRRADPYARERATSLAGTHRQASLRTRPCW